MHASAWALASWTSRSITSRLRMRSPARSSEPNAPWGRVACATCIRTADSGCSNDRWRIEKSPRWSADGICTWGAPPALRLRRVADEFTLSPFEFFVLHTRTRFPFRYGIASMTDVPHVFVRTRVTCGGRSEWGLTAEGLPPKWFTKNPVTTFDEDLPDMFAVIGHA